MFIEGSVGVKQTKCLTVCVAVASSEMSCLMEALQDKRVRLQPECKKRLQDRIDMWSYAAKVHEPQLLHPVSRNPLNTVKTQLEVM